MDAVRWSRVTACALALSGLAGCGGDGDSGSSGASASAGATGSGGTVVDTDPGLDGGRAPIDAAADSGDDAIAARPTLRMATPVADIQSKEESSKCFHTTAGNTASFDVGVWRRTSGWRSICTTSTRATPCLTRAWWSAKERRNRGFTSRPSP